MKRKLYRIFMLLMLIYVLYVFNVALFTMLNPFQVFTGWIIQCLGFYEILLTLNNKDLLKKKE